MTGPYREIPKLVFCAECKYRGMNWEDEKCKHLKSESVKITPFSQSTVFSECKVINKNNDCNLFEQFVAPLSDWQRFKRYFKRNKR